MATNQTIDFKDALWITAWLDTALEKEKEKYEKCPVKSDLPEGFRCPRSGHAKPGRYARWLLLSPVAESFKVLLYLRRAQGAAQDTLH